VIVVLATYPVSIVKTGFGATLEVYWTELVGLSRLEVPIGVAAAAGVRLEVEDMLGVGCTVSIWVEVKVLWVLLAGAVVEINEVDCIELDKVIGGTWVSLTAGVERVLGLVMIGIDGNEIKEVEGGKAEEEDCVEVVEYVNVLCIVTLSVDGAEMTKAFAVGRIRETLM